MAQKGMRLSDELGVIKESASLHLFLSQAYEKTGSLEMSLTHLQLHNDFRDSLFNKDIAMQLQYLQMAFDTEKQQDAYERLELENQLKEGTIVRQYLILLIFSLLLIFFILGLVSLYVARQKSKADYRLLFENANDGIVLIQEEKIIHINPRVASILGYTEKEIVGKKIQNFLFSHPVAGKNPDQVLKDHLETVYQGGQSQSEWLIQKKDGTSIWIEISMNPIRSPESRSALLLWRDISAQKEAAKLKEINQQHMEMVFNSVQEAMLLIKHTSDKGFLIETGNAGFLHMLQPQGAKVDLEQVIGTPVSAWLNHTILSLESHSMEEFLARLESAVKVRKGTRYIIRHLNENKILVYQINIRPIIREGNICTHLLLVIQDLTDTIDKEEQVLHKVYQALEEEWSRIAGELHDNLTQTLSIASLYLKNLPYDYSQIRTEEKFLKAIGYLEAAIDESRSLAHRIMPKAIEDFGLVSTISELVESTKEIYPIEVQFEHNLTARLPKKYELNLFRIVQEAISNTVKHARATKIHIHLKISEILVSLVIEDDGKGISREVTDGSKMGLGIRSMKSRTTQLGGLFQIQNRHQGGTRISVRIPLTIQIYS